MHNKHFWVELSNRVCDTHKELGGAAFLLATGEPALQGDGDAFVVFKPDMQLEVEGTELLPGKHIRAFLHTAREHVWYNRENMAVWAGYDEETNTSIVGLALVVPNAVAERAKDKYLTAGSY